MPEAQHSGSGRNSQRRSRWMVPKVQPVPVSNPAFEPQFGAEPFPGYKLLWLRGRGGFATVWESTTPSGEHIALKFMSSQNSHSAARELRSIQSIQSLSHPNLLRIRQVWTLPGQVVIGMDLAEGSLLDLHMLYAEEFDKRIDITKLLDIYTEISSALDYLNARKHLVEGRHTGYQHGDIKPNNILLLNDKAMLADYGLATPTSGNNTSCPRHGTLEYAAPEVFQGYVTESSDQFSLAVMYHLLRTGAYPYPAPPSDLSQVKKGYQRPAPDLHLLTPIEQPILAKALHTIPQNRFANCGEFVHALRIALGYPAPVKSELKEARTPIPTRSGKSGVIGMVLPRE